MTDLPRIYGSFAGKVAECRKTAISSTLPETTPVLEAAALQEDLRRALIEPWAWVINSSLSAVGPSDPLLVARAMTEQPQIEKVRTTLSHRIALVPWLAEEPVGPERLRELARNPNETAHRAAPRPRA